MVTGDLVEFLRSIIARIHAIKNKLLRSRSLQIKIPIINMDLKLSVLLIINPLFVYQVAGLSCYSCEYEDFSVNLSITSRESPTYTKRCIIAKRIKPVFCNEEDVSCLKTRFTARKGPVISKVWRRHCAEGKDAPTEGCKSQLPKNTVVDPSYYVTDVETCYCSEFECNTSSTIVSLNHVLLISLFLHGITP